MIESKNDLKDTWQLRSVSLCWLNFIHVMWLPCVDWIAPPYISCISITTVLRRNHFQRLSAILNSDSLRCYLMMTFADDAFSNLVFFCKTCLLHAASVAPNKSGPTKYTEWQWSCWRFWHVGRSLFRDAATWLANLRINTAIRFPCPCVTVHEANEWKKIC